MRFHIITFGCQMNVGDSSWLGKALLGAGHELSSLEDAQMVFLNTCSVREKPERKVIAAIRRIETECSGLQLIGVLGCVAQQLGEKLFDASPHVRLVAGGDHIDQAPYALKEILSGGGKACLLQFAPEYRERPVYAQPDPSGSAFVNIMQGCDNFCSYCIVPFTRGRQKSRRLDAVIAECESWLQSGVSEITLLGQNVNAWGKDLEYGDGTFAGLLRRVAALPGLERLRFVTPHPKDLSDDIISCFADLKNLCPRLHLPLQSGSDAILSAMRRRHGTAEYLELVDSLRKARPDLAFSTDLIVGFPGETEIDFQQTIDMVEECGFMSSFSFCYSDRPGTKASRMPLKVDKAESLERLGRLQQVQDDLTGKWLKGRLGQNVKLLIEAPSTRGGENFWQGRDVYGVCVNVELPAGIDYRGKTMEVEITEAKKHSLAARMCFGQAGI